MIVAADDGARLAAVLARLDDGDGRHVVVVTDRPDVLSTRTGALRRYSPRRRRWPWSPSCRPAASCRRCAAASCASAACASGGGLPTLASAPVRTESTRPDVSVAVAADAARRLARIHDPEDPDEAAGACPTSVALSRVLARAGLAAIDDSIAIAAGWRSAAGPTASRRATAIPGRRSA